MYQQPTGPPASSFDYATFPSTTPPLPHSAASGFELRPLSTGEVLDRTFALYRQRFWLYCGLSAIAAGMGTLVQLVQMIFMGNFMPGLSNPAAIPGGSNPPTPAALAAMFGGLALTYVAMLVHLCAYSVAHAATISAVTSIYLGHDTSAAIAFKAIRGKWWRYICITLWQGWSMVWIFMLLLVPGAALIGLSAARGGNAGALLGAGMIVLLLAFASLVYGLIAYLRNSFAIAASVFEKLPVRQSMRRSKTLAVDMKWRLFLLMLMLTVIGMVAGGLLFPFALWAQHSHAMAKLMAEGAQLILTFLTQTLIGPVGAIALCLFYFDSRVRKEGFDIETLMDRSIGSPLSVSPSPAWQTQAGFAPSGFTAEPPAPPLPPPLTGVPASPFAPSEFAAPAAPFAPGRFTDVTPASTIPESGNDVAMEQE